MEGGGEAANVVGNQIVNHSEQSHQQETPNSEQIYQQHQHPQHPLQNQSSGDRPMEIPAAKVHKTIQYRHSIS